MDMMRGMGVGVGMMIGVGVIMMRGMGVWA